MCIDWDNIGLGTKSDNQIALELGVDRRKVCTERNKRKIKPFLGLYILVEGVPCRSLYEAMYDVYLHENGISHSHEKKVGSCIVDFEVNGELHEIAGMKGFKRYEQRHVKKQQYYIDNNISVKWLDCANIEQMYKTCKNKVTCRERFCLDCGKRTLDIVKNVCRDCYMKRWHDKGNLQICKTCKQSFTAPEKDNRIYCSHKCYAENLKKIDHQMLIKEIEKSDRSIAAIAREYNIKPTTLYMMFRRNRKRIKWQENTKNLL